MPPKRVAKAKLHQLAVELPFKTIISDLSTKKQYCVGRQFATGGFGRIYTCNEVGSKTELVVKVEPYGNGPLFTELNVFVRIFKPDQIAQFMRERKLKRLGVPKMISGGIHQHGDDKLRFLVIPKYATSLETIREKRKTFTQHEVWTIARCMMESLEYIHSKNYTHADIKAGNILLEKADDFSTSVLADFGLARMSSSNEDKPDKKRAHNGTAIFTSCDAHRGCQPSYRGDLEILAYNMLYWLSGSLPWEAYESNPDKVYQMKEAFLKGLPSILKQLLKNNQDSVAPLNEIADDVLKRAAPSRQGKRKTPDETAEVKKPTPAKRNKIASSPRYGTQRDRVRNTPKDSPVRHVRLRAAAKPDIRVLDRTSSPRVPRSLPSPDTCSSSSPPQQSLQKPSPSARVRAHAKRLPSTISRKSPRLAAGGIVPGLSVRRAPCSPLNVQLASSDNKGLGCSTPVNGAGSSRQSVERVTSDVKRSPNKLRKIPGMQNFARGRRSIVIDQITKKYKRIAEKKNRLS
ncbi:hypothetical protein OSTOST_05183 [Ostertagia ostertagi]